MTAAAVERQVLDHRAPKPVPLPAAQELRGAGVELEARIKQDRRTTVARCQRGRRAAALAFAGFVDDQHFALAPHQHAGSAFFEEQYRGKDGGLE